MIGEHTQPQCDPLLDWHEEDGTPVFAPPRTAKFKTGTAAWAEEVVWLNLKKGEQLLWQGRPRRDVVLHPIDFAYMATSIIVCGFAAMWLVQAAAYRASWSIVLVGIVLGAYGFYSGFGRLWHAARMRGRMCFTVTSARVLIIRGGLFGRVQSLDLKSLPEVTLDLRRDGSGTLFLGSVAFWGSWLESFPFQPEPWYEKVTRLELGANVRQVYDILCEARRRARAHSST